VSFQSRALLAFNRKPVDQAALSIVGGPWPAIIVRWCFGPRRARCGSDLPQSLGLRPGLSSKDRLRCHVRRRCRGSGENLCCAGVPRRWQTDAVAGDYHRGIPLQCCVGNEEQRNQRKTNECKKGKDWHYAGLRHTRRGRRSRLVAQLISKTDCYMRGVFLPADINQNGDSFGGESATALCL